MTFPREKYIRQKINYRHISIWSEKKRLENCQWHKCIIYFWNSSETCARRVQSDSNDISKTEADLVFYSDVKYDVYYYTYSRRPYVRCYDGEMSPALKHPDAFYFVRIFDFIIIIQRARVAVNNWSFKAKKLLLKILICRYFTKPLLIIQRIHYTAH